MLETSPNDAAIAAPVQGDAHDAVIQAPDQSADMDQQRLDHADKLETMASTEEHHAEPVFIWGPGGWVGVAMLVFLGIVLWKGVHKAIGGGLDKKIAEIRQQLDEAKSLRAEAETLREEYAKKIAGAEKDAAAMLDHAKVEAEAIVAKAETDTEAMIKRRKQMAEDKISAAERAAVDRLRGRTAELATTAARRVIAREHGEEADASLVDKEISAI